MTHEYVRFYKLCSAIIYSHLIIQFYGIELIAFLLYQRSECIISIAINSFNIYKRIIVHTLMFQRSIELDWIELVIIYRCQVLFCFFFLLYASRLHPLPVSKSANQPATKPASVLKALIPYVNTMVQTANDFIVYCLK